MAPALSLFVEAGAAIVAALVIAGLRVAIRALGTVKETATSTAELAAAVATLQARDADTRERLAALYGPRWTPAPPGRPPWNGATPHDPFS